MRHVLEQPGFEAGGYTVGSGAGPDFAAAYGAQPPR